MTLPEFSMPFEPMTIEHLGLRLYSTVPPVISELVSNAYDAESRKVDITVPAGVVTSESEVVVRDYGHGMDGDELQSEYLPIGRNRRGRDGKQVMSKNGKVRVTGRKGLGKLSSFGVAAELEVRSIKSGQAICLILNYDDMMHWVENHRGEPYKPRLVRERTGPTDEPTGLEVRLRGFHRKRSIDVDAIRRGLARRLLFIGKSFQVFINGATIGPGDRVLRDECPEGFSWDVADIPRNGKVGENLTVTGWVGFLEKSSQTGRGIDIFASGKAVELGSFFNFQSTHVQFARAHIVGEIDADFLDGDQDLVATARNSVLWESDAGMALQEWGRKALKWSFEQWLEMRRKAKETKVITEAGFDKWLGERQPREQRVARRMVSLLIDDPNIESSSMKGLLEIVKSSVETVAFMDLVDTIEREGANATTLLKLFDEWRIIEAREHLRLADGRMAGIEQLQQFIREGALEVKQMQPLFEENPWLLDPAWTEADAQTTYTKLLRERCKEPKDYEDAERRLDILGIRAGGGLAVVELKRPEKTLSRKDLEQIEKYVDWARNQFSGTGSDAPKYVHGLLLVGKLSSSGDVQLKQQRLAGSDIRVELYADIYNKSREYYGHADSVLQKTAPEYSRLRRKSGSKDRNDCH